MPAETQSPIQNRWWANPNRTVRLLASSQKRRMHHFSTRNCCSSSITSIRKRQNQGSKKTRWFRKAPPRTRKSTRHSVLSQNLGNARKVLGKKMAADFLKRKILQLTQPWDQASTACRWWEIWILREKRKTKNSPVSRKNRRVEVPWSTKWTSKTSLSYPKQNKSFLRKSRSSWMCKLVSFTVR